MLEEFTKLLIVVGIDLILYYFIKDLDVIASMFWWFPSSWAYQHGYDLNSTQRLKTIINEGDEFDIFHPQIWFDYQIKNKFNHFLFLLFKKKYPKRKYYPYNPNYATKLNSKSNDNKYQRI